MRVVQVRSDRRFRRGRALTVVAAVTALAAAGAVAVSAPASAATGPGPIMQPSASNVTADALPTTQIDGVAWTQVVIGNTVYVGGNFSHARPAGVAVGGAGTVARSDLLAYNLTTGVLISTFAPTLNGQVLALAASPDGTKLFVGGDFTQVNGAVHNRIAEFNAATGALVTTFTAGVDAGVKALAATNTTLYAGGLFSTASGTSRTRLAAFQTSNGAVTPWAPSADYTVDAMVLTPDGTDLVVGGAFLHLNSLTVQGIGAVSASTGASVNWVANQTVFSYGTGAAILSLATDGNAVYGTAYNFHGTGNIEGAFSADPDTGKINWVEDCHGDTYGVFAVNSIVYTVSHAHFCANDGGWPVYNPWQYRHSVAFTAAATGTLAPNSQAGYPNHAGLPAPSIINWFPDFVNGTFTGQNQAAWSVAGNSQYVVEGGEFPTVNGTAQQGLVRFAVPSIAPNKSGPMVTGAHFTPTLKALSNTSVQVSFASNWDRDDEALTYKIVRDSDLNNPVWSTTANSEWWNLPTLSFTDTGLLPGTTYKYRLYVSDPAGNTVAGDTVTITTPGTAPVTTPPVAAFTSSTSNLTASFNAGGSTAPSGTITGYSWNFGDGSASGSGVTPTHTYATAGSYSVSLTVTDSNNVSDSVTKSVTVSNAAPATSAADAFGRSVAGGWGSADTGGPWTLNGSASLFAVGGGVGTISLTKAGAGPSAYLNSVSTRDLTGTVDVAFNSVPTGNGYYAYLIVRHSSTGDYRVQIKVLPTSTTISLTKVVGGTTTTIASKTISMTYTAGEALRLKLQVSGAAPTTLAGKVWPVGTAEPAAFQVSGTDSEASLQTAGAVGVMAYLSSTVTTVPVAASFDNLSAG
jgi:PKD repeat protein